MTNSKIYRSINQLGEQLPLYQQVLRKGRAAACSGVCGFDGFIDTFIRIEQPPSMEAFGPKIAAAAGIATSFPVRHLGDKFGGNGPLFACALHDLYRGMIEMTYVGAVGDGAMHPVFDEALSSRMSEVVSLAAPAQSDCLEFTDGKVMLNDLSTCDEVTWDRVVERWGEDRINHALSDADCIAAVNWGKLPHAGPIWSSLAERLQVLGRPPKEVLFFMDLAEFEHRAEREIEDLLHRLGPIQQQCSSMLSFNLKEAWQMGEVFGGHFKGRKDPEAVTELAAFIFSHLKADRVIIHPNEGAACVSEQGAVYVPGPFCAAPLISTGAGDNFGAGCLAAALLDMDDTGIVLTGNCTSGTFVRSGRSPSLSEIADFQQAWLDGTLGDRL